MVTWTFRVFVLVACFCCRCYCACRDGWGSSGSCVLARDCQAVVRMMARPMTSQNVTLLRRSVCIPSARAKGFHICCAFHNETHSGDANNTTQQTPTPSTTTPPPLSSSQVDPKSPEAHPNRRLLPRPPRCGMPMAGHRIVGGEVTRIGEFGWMALLGFKGLDYYYDTYDYDYDFSTTESQDNATDDDSATASDRIVFGCGGSLINSRYVLTAAHCIPDGTSETELVVVRLGEYNLSTSIDCVKSVHGVEFCSELPVDVAPEDIMVHKRFHKPRRNNNDIALIRLSRDVTFTGFINPICLPFEAARTRSLDDKLVVVAGFGLSQAYGDMSPVMLKAAMHVVNMTYCGRRLRTLGAHITKRQLCAGGKLGVDTCRGDSGGPLMAGGRYGPPLFLHGIVSFGTENCGESGTPAVYARVSSYMNWILRQLKP